MPKVKYTRSKGLVQEAGNGFEVDKLDGVTAGGQIAPFIQDAVSQNSAAGGGAGQELTPTCFHTNIQVDAGGDGWALKDGSVKGQRHQILLSATAGGVGDVALENAESAALDIITFTNAGDLAELMWNGNHWKIIALRNIANGGIASPTVA